MKTSPPRRAAALLALGCMLFPASRAAGQQPSTQGEPENAFRVVLLSRARALEQRGRLDLAKQEWTQVLALDAGNAEALAGLVRAARAEGRSADATQFLARLRAAHPQAPELAQLENHRPAQSTATDLADASRLEQAGDHRGAFTLLRRVYGNTPPPGAPALAYYGAQSALEEGRPEAIAGLRALADRYPADSRYPIALGRVLVRSPRTRAEGRTLLERFSNDPEAVAALQGGGGGEQHAGNMISSPARPGGSAATPSAVSEKPSPAAPLAATTGSAPRPGARIPEDRGTPPPTVRSVAAVGREARHQGFAAQEQSGFAALNGHRAAEAEQIFSAILAKDPGNPRALAGLGYLRVTTGDLKMAVNLFERAQENGDRSLALTRALINAQNQLSLEHARTASTAGDVQTAEGQYRTVLRDRPSDPDALQGLGQVLLRSGHAADAIPVFTRLTEVRPLDPEAWRGLVISQSSAGQGGSALATDKKVPEEARAPLASDASYLQALATARSGTATQVARVEPPPAPKVTAPPPVPRPAPSSVTQPPPTPTASTTQASSTRAGTAVGGPPAAASLAPAPAPAATGASPSQAPALGAAAQPSQVATGRRVLPPASIPGSAVPSSVRPQAPAATAKNTPPSRAGRRGSRNTSPPATPTLAAVQPPVTHPTSVAPPAPSPNLAIAAERTTQANASLSAGDNVRAAELFRASLAAEPDRAEAWRGLVTALHAAGRDGEALGALAQVPDGARTVLERDATFQSTAGALYLAAARPGEALRALVRAQEVFASQGLQPPLDLVLRLTTLLAARNDDGNLYRELMYLGQRPDMSDVQRRDVQMIWTSWAVRRARSLAGAGEQRRAVVILNAAAEAFSGNNQVLQAVAGGYAGVGLPREAVALLKAQDLSQASARELEAAVAAGIAAHDFRAANQWARLGQDRFPSDPEMLTAVAELEQARGHNGRAVELTQKARTLAPREDPAAVLTAELREAPAGHGWGAPAGGQLATLLSPTLASGTPAQAARPFLPGAPLPSGGQAQTVQTPVLSAADEPTR